MDHRHGQLAALTLDYHLRARADASQHRRKVARGFLFRDVDHIVSHSAIIPLSFLLIFVFHVDCHDRGPTTTICPLTDQRHYPTFAESRRTSATVQISNASSFQPVLTPLCPNRLRGSREKIGRGPMNRAVRRRERKLPLPQSLFDQLEQLLSAGFHSHSSISESSESLDSLASLQFGKEPIRPVRQCRKPKLQNQRRPDEHWFLTDEQQPVLLGIADHLLRQPDQVPQWTLAIGDTDGAAKAGGRLAERDDPLDALGIDGGKGIVVGEGGGQRTDFRVTAYDGDQVCLAVFANPGAQMNPDVCPCFLRAPQVNQFSKSFMRIFHRLSLSPPFP